MYLLAHMPCSDPDIEHLPFFAITPLFFRSLWSSYYKRTMAFDRFAAFFVSLQHRLFYIVMAFARFNLYINSYTFLFRKAFDTPRARGGKWAWRLEIVGLVFFWLWFGSVLRGCGSWSKALSYLLVSHAVTSPLHVQASLFVLILLNKLPRPVSRSFFLTFQCQQLTWGLLNPFLTGNYAQQLMLYAHRHSVSFMAAFTFKLHITSFRGSPGITFARQVHW